MSALSIPTNVVSRPTSSIFARTYATRFRLFVPFHGQDQIVFTGAPVLHPNAGGERRIEPLCRRVVEHIFGLEGVDSVMVRPFEIDILRSSAFAWECLDAPLKYLIESADPANKSVRLRTPDVDHQHRVLWVGDMRSHDLRHYGLTVRMFAPKNNLDTKRYFPPLQGTRKQPLTAEGEALIKQLSRIEGIDCVNFDPFEVNICKYSDYSWNQLHEPILEALSDCFPDDATVILRSAH